MRLNLFRKEGLRRYLGTDRHFVKALGAFDLSTIDIDVVIGTGTFTLPDTAATREAGPGITLSFLVAALVCILANMCYTELPSSIPVASSAYSYGNIPYGEVIGWILGWTLILEYTLSVVAVSAGWASYLSSLLHNFSLYTPRHFEESFDPLNGTYLSLWTVIGVLLIGALPSRGIETSMKFNSMTVLIETTIIFIFIGVGLFFIRLKNCHLFTPYGTTGVLRGAATVFSVLLGFGVVSSSAAEVKDLKKDMPIGIISTLVVVALLYMGVPVVLTEMVNYKQLGVANPVVYTLKLTNQNQATDLLSIEVIVGTNTTVLTMIYSSLHLIYFIGHDGSLSNFLGKIDKHGLPENALWIVAIVIALMGGLFSLEELTSLVSIGASLTPTSVSFGAILSRRGKDIPESNFKVPPYPVTPALSGLVCIGMMCFLSVKTYLFVGAWFLFGLFIYCVYGYRHSKISKENN